MQSTDDSKMIAASEIIMNEENKIDLEKKIHLITWSPDPKELPDNDFRYQHLFNVNILADFLKTCKCGLFCVEYTQKGYPHYHGWYQEDTSKNLERTAIVKTLDRFGNLKFTTANKVKIDKWYEKGNALWYYKKELCECTYKLPHSPITKDSVDDTNWEYKNFFTKEMGKGNISSVISERKFYRQFYQDSDI